MNEHPSGIIPETEHERRTLEYGDLVRATAGESDRGLVITTAAHVEFYLERILKAFFVNSSEVSGLFEGPFAPFGNLSAKTKAALLMGLISKDEARRVDAMRKVRNVFAHEITASFEHPDVRKLLREGTDLRRAPLRSGRLPAYGNERGCPLDLPRYRNFSSPQTAAFDGRGSRPLGPHASGRRPMSYVGVRPARRSVTQLLVGVIIARYTRVPLPATEQMTADIQPAQIFFPYAFERQKAVKSQGTRFVHYTRADAAMSIIKTKAIWMRKTSCMNDFMEVHHGLECLTDTYNGEVGALLKANLNIIFSGITNKIEQLFNGWIHHLASDTYVTCFSKHLARRRQFWPPLNVESIRRDHRRCLGRQQHTLPQAFGCSKGIFEPRRISRQKGVSRRTR